MILVIDNYDSFVFNLAQYLGECGTRWKVVRNDAVTWRNIQRLKPRGIVLSPGPGHPRESRVCLDILRAEHEIPILGVCLGHQAMGEVFGARVGLSPQMVHGKSSRIRHDGRGVFRGLENPLEVVRYHSLCVQEPLPPALIATAHTEEGVLMGMRHVQRPFEGVQFHPESFLSQGGRQLIKNFVEKCGAR